MTFHSSQVNDDYLRGYGEGKAYARTKKFFKKGALKFIQEVSWTIIIVCGACVAVYIASNIETIVK